MLGQGYPSTTVEQICEAAELTKGSFYHFFSSKEELGLEVLRRDYEAIQSGIAACVSHQEPDLVKRAFSFLDALEERAKAMWSKGSLLGSFAMELAETNRNIRSEVSAEFDGLVETIGAVLEPIHERTGESSPTGAELAVQLLAVVEGAVILARAYGDWKRIPTAIRQFRRMVAASAGELA